MHVNIIFNLSLSFNNAIICGGAAEQLEWNEGGGGGDVLLMVIDDRRCRCGTCRRTRCGVPGDCCCERHRDVSLQERKDPTVYLPTVPPYNFAFSHLNNLHFLAIEFE